MNLGPEIKRRKYQKMNFSVKLFVIQNYERLTPKKCIKISFCNKNHTMMPSDGIFSKGKGRDDGIKNLHLIFGTNSGLKTKEFSTPRKKHTARILHLKI